MSSLSSQLSSIYDASKNPDIQLLRQDSKLRESILFDPKIAADLDNDEIFHLALDGFSELTKLCSDFNRFEHDFFSAAAKQRRRADLTAQENAHISTMLSQLMPLLSCFYLQDCGLKALEWLIRHFHVHLMDTDLFMSSFLLYHETPLFPKAVRILGGLTEHFWVPTNHSNNWLFLTDIRKSQSPINRDFLVKRCLADFSFVKIVQETHSKFINIAERFPAFASNWISFTTVVMIEYISQIPQPSVPKNVLIYFVPIVMNHLECSCSASTLPSHIMLLCQMLSKSQISKDATMQLLRTLINISVCPTQVFMAVVFLLESQQCITYETVNDQAELSDIFNYLLRNYVLLANFVREKTAKKVEEFFLRGIVELNHVSVLSLFLLESQSSLQLLQRTLESSLKSNCSLNDCQLHLQSYLQQSATQTEPMQQQSIAKEQSTKEMITEFVETFSKLADVDSQISFVELSVDFFKKICTTESINVQELIPMFIFLLRHSEKSVRINSLQILAIIKDRLIASNEQDANSTTPVENKKLTVFSSKANYKLPNGLLQLIQFILDGSEQISGSNQAILSLSTACLQIIDVYQMFLLSFPPNQRISAFAFAAIELATNSLPITQPLILRIDSLLQPVLNNSSFEASLSQFLDILLTFEELDKGALLKIASHFSTYLCSIENSSRVSFMKIIRFFCKLWRTQPSINSELFFMIIKAIGQNSLLKSAFTPISLSTEDVEPVFEKLLEMEAGNESRAKRMQLDSDDRFDLLQGLFEFLLFQFVSSSPLSPCNNEKCTQIDSNSSSIIIEGESEKPLNAMDSNFVFFILNGSFEILSSLLGSCSIPSGDYVKQLILSLITEIIQSKHSVKISTCEDSVRVDVLVNCLRSSTNSQTQSQCFVAISSIARIAPQRTIDCIIPLFTFMGTSLLRRDDPHSLAVVLQAIREIIPVVLQASSIDAAEILALFVTALDHIPTHRIHPIFNELLQCLSAQHSFSYWLDMLVWTCAVQRVTNSFSKGKVEFPTDDLVELFLTHPSSVAMQALYETMKRLVLLANFESKQFKQFLAQYAKHSIELVTSQEQVIRIRKEIGSFYESLLQELIAKEQLFKEGEEEIGCIGELIEKLLESFSIFGNEKSIFVAIFSTIMRHFMRMSDFVRVIDRLLRSKNVLIQRKGLQLLNDKLVVQPLDLSSSTFNLTILSQFATLLSQQLINSIGKLNENISYSQCLIMALDILAKAIASQNVIEFSSIARHLVTYLKESESNDLKITIISSFASFISAIPTRLISSISDYVPILLNMLSSATESMKVDDEKKAKRQVSVNSQQQRISNYSSLELNASLSTLNAIIKHQGAFISPYLSQITSLLFALNKYSNSLGKNLRITLEDIFTSIPTTIEPRILLPVLFQFPNEYQKIIPLIAESSQFVTPDSLIPLLPSLTDYFQGCINQIATRDSNDTFYPEYQKTDFYLQFIVCLKGYLIKMNNSLLEQFINGMLTWNIADPVLNSWYFCEILLCCFETLNVLFSPTFQALSHQLISSIFTNLPVWSSSVKLFKVYFELCSEILPSDQIQLEWSECLLQQYDRIANDPKHLDYLLSSITTCTVSFGRAIGGQLISTNEIWQSFHDKFVAAFTVAGCSHVHKTMFCRVLRSFFDAWGEEYLSFLPALLPIVADLLEDANENVEVEAKELTIVIEKYLGEPIMKYF